jgi:iron(II)-dependent oxidoreductase
MAVAHDTRWDLPLPDLAATLRYAEDVRDTLLARIDRDDMSSEQESYYHQLTVFHEDMHDEAFIYMRQTLGYRLPLLTGADGQLAPDAGPLPGDAEVPGGVHMLGGEPSDAYAMDNEQWGHGYELDPFRIARAAVTNEEFAAFVDDGAYRNEALWSPQGWGWRNHAKAEHPVYWMRDGAGWLQRAFDRTAPLRPHAPVIHVNWFEADAWCRWAGRRLPTEAEWEVAASRAPVDGSGGGDRLRGPKRRYPWGDDAPSAALANLDGIAGGVADVAAYADGDSAWGCRQMVGNVWEWTNSTFQPYPGFTPGPYADYSAPWFADGRPVLRGGGWATRSRFIWNTWRNFFTPERRDVFAGFRTCGV